MIAIPRNERVRSFGIPIFLFVLNLFVCGRLLHTKYMDQRASIEGAFIALDRYIAAHWPFYDWFPLWLGGMPFTRVYQPGLHYTVAAAIATTGWDAAFAYHVVTAIAYSLGGVTFYFLARALTSDTPTAFTGALLFSLFSPSLLLIPVIRHDAGGVWHARRLQALVQYGEGPNVTGLMLAMLALAAVHWALTRRTPLTAGLAALAVAAVPATNWPATMALLMALVGYVLALSRKDLRAAAARLLAIGAGAVGFALPFAPPSSVLETFARANVMTDSPTPGAGRWISFALLAVALVALRAVLAWCRTPFKLRFPLLWFLLTGWVVICATSTGTRMITQPVRFHLAMEIPLALAFAVCAVWVVRRWPAIRYGAAVALALFCCLQGYNYRRYVHSQIHPLDVEKTAEYQMARWCEANLHGERIFTAGTFGFWLNDFTSTPQMTGFFEQSVSNSENRVAAYIVPTGYGSESESAGYSLLWLKAWAAAAIQIGGPQTADVYHDFQFPNRFRNVLPVVWSRGDDFVYRVPERTAGLARVVRKGDLIRHAPQNGIDVAELRPFVAALDDASLPLSKFEWLDLDTARIAGSLAPDQVYSVAINYDPGWTAKRDGHSVPLHPDGMGMIAVEPGCSGNCEVQLHWSPGVELPLVIAAFLVTLAAFAVWRARDQL